MMRWSLALLVTLSVTLTSAEVVGRESCSSRNTAVLEENAQVFLGGLLEFSTSGGSSYGCGGPASRGMQEYEAMRWTIDRLNQDRGTINGRTIRESYIPGVKLGMMVRDTCRRPELAVDYLSAFLPEVAGSAESCQRNTSSAFMGVVSGGANELTAYLTKALAGYQVPVVSFTATSPVLADSQRYPYLMRTVPSADVRAQVMLATMASLGWTHVTVVYADSSEGVAGFKGLTQVAANAGICIGYATRVPVNGTESVYGDAMRRLVAAGPSAVVYVGDQQTVTSLLDAAGSVYKSGRLQWLLPDTVGTNALSLTNRNSALGSLTVAPAGRHIAEFEDHWVMLSDTSRPTGNPWYRHWYMTANSCRLPGVNYAPYNAYNQCPAVTKAQRRTTYRQSPYVEPAILSIYTYAKAIRTAHQDLCSGYARGLCARFLRMTSEDFYKKYLLPVDMTFGDDERIPSLASRLSGPYRAPRRVRFNMAGDIVDPVYAVYNYNDRTGVHKFHQVGTFSGGSLTLDKNQLRFYDANRRVVLNNPPTSRCPDNRCASCLTGGSSAQRPVHLPGDVLIGGLFSVHLPGATALSCGAVNTQDGAELLEAFLYGVQHARRLNHWRGSVTLGAVAFDDCSSPQLASNTLINFLDGEDFGINVDAKKVQGYTAGNDDAITLAVAVLLKQIPLPQIGYKSAPGILSDQAVFPGFAELLPGRSDGIHAVTQMLRRLGVSHMRVIHDNSEASKQHLDGFQQLALADEICVGGIGFSDPGDFQSAIDSIKVKPDSKVLYLNGDFSHFERMLVELNRSVDAGNYLIIPSAALKAETNFANKRYRFRALTWLNKSPIIDGWREHLRSLTPDKESVNPFLKEWYQKVFNCYLDSGNQQGFPARCRRTASTPITAGPGYQASPYSAYVVLAVGSLARSIDKALQQYCGAGYRAVCSQYTNAADLFETIVGFLRNDPYLKGDIVNGFNVAYMRPQALGFTIVGDVKFESTPTGRAAKLSLGSGVVANIGAVASSCGKFCQDCLYMYENQAAMFLPGQILLAALFNVHDKGDGAYDCGDLRPADGFQHTAAFQYAVQTVNGGTAPVSLHGMLLGGLGLDTCSSQLRAANLASSVYAGAIMPRDHQGNPVDISKVKGWLTYGSGISERAAGVLGLLGLGVVSPSASSVSLSDASVYPTFYRTVPSDDKRSRATAGLLDYFRWRYVQTVNSPDADGRTALRAFRAVLAKSSTSTCAVASYELSTDGGADDVIAKLLASSTSVVALFGGPEVAQLLLRAKMRAGEAADKLVFVVGERIPDSAGASNVLAFGVNTPTLQGFNSYLAGIVPGGENANPWFNAVYQTVYKCDLPGSSTHGTPCVDLVNRPLPRAPGFQQDPHVLTTINAVYALVKAVDLALIDRCGDSYSSVCKEFMSAPDAMQLIVSKLDEVVFRDPSGEDVGFVDRQHDRGYAIYKYGSNGDSIRIGDYKAGLLTMTDDTVRTEYKHTVSLCPGTCLQCQYQQQQNQQFTSIPGDVYLAGLFDVHRAGAAPFSCGEINAQQGWQLVEAFNFAIARVNNKTGLFHNRLPGVRLGGAGLDTCSSPSRAANLVANVQSGLLPLMMGKTRIPPDRIDVYIGAYDSDTSAAVATFLKVLGVPQLSYGATSTAFRDTGRYPNFLRTVPADDKLARAVVALLKNYKIEYVQVVHSPGTYGDAAAREFSSLAADNEICVGQEVRLAAGGGGLADWQAEQAARHLLNKPHATVVVTFIDTADINAFLKAVSRVTKVPKFHFVGSETWSSRVNLLRDVGDAARDALTLGVETADLSTFDKYLRAIAHRSHKTNPWFTEYYESVFECSLTPGSGKNPRPCPPNRDIVLAPGYTQDPYVLYTVNAVYSAALGLDYALKQTCGNNYFGVCDEFRNAPNRRQLILKGMRKATFQDATNQKFDFSDNGESNRGYHIYTARKAVDSPNYYYENVGSYNDTDLLKIRPQQSFAVTWVSNCSSPGSCEECGVLGHRSTRGMDRSDPNLNLVGFFDVHDADPLEPLRCGALNSDFGFQNMLAFFFAIDRFNSKNSLKVHLGGLAIDTCSSDIRVSRDLFSLLMGQGLCEADGIGSKVDPSSIIGVIPHSPRSAKMAASLLAPRRVTMVSPTTSADTLVGSPYFLSTIPPQAKQAEAMAAVARELGWTYMAAVNSQSAAHESRMRAFFKAAGAGAEGHVICVGNRFTLTDGATAEDAVAVVRKINRIRGSRVVALFTTPAHTRLLLEAVNAEGLGDQFVFLGMDGSGRASKVTHGLGSVSNGAIMFKVRTGVGRAFVDYVTNLTVARHGQIPDDWFAQFWQQALKCKLENSSVAQDAHARVCAPSDRLSAATVRQDDFVLQTVIATYITAQGLLNAGDCQRSPLSVAGCLREKGAGRRAAIFDGVRSSSWNDPWDDFTFRFLPGGYGNTGLIVLSYQRVPGEQRYEYKQIGFWSDEEGLRLKTADYLRGGSPGSPAGTSRPPRSACPAGASCSCVDYSGAVIGAGGRGTIAPITAPVAGGAGWLHSNMESTWGVVVAALAAGGILVTLGAFVYLLLFYPIKGGTSVIGYILLVAVLAMYVLVFAFVLNDVPETCAVRRFCLGLVYSLVFSCMLVKVLNTWRLGAYFTEYLPSYQRLAHPCSLVFIVLSLTLVQVIIGTEWLILKPPTVETVIYEGRGLTRCSPADFHNVELVLSCIYVMVLMLLTLIFSAVTWDSEENHRESRWLLITTAFTIGIMLVWTIVSTMTALRYREPSIAIALVVNATIILLAIFVRKIYLLGKYRKEAEEERKSQFAINADQTKDHDFYSTLYNNQAFDNSGEAGSRKGMGSHTGSGVVYVYDGTADNHQAVAHNTY